MTKMKSFFMEPLNILLVDDNIVDRKLLEFVLKKASSNVSLIHTAKDLKSALAILGDDHIDVVLLDLNLPDSKGLDTLQKVRQLHPSVAIVVNTGAYEDALGLLTLSHGAQDFIVKGKYKSYGLIKSIHYAKERKRIESELLTAYKNLQETQSQLIQAEKMHVVGRLASGVAHEVKNPLSTILFGVAYLNEKIRTNDEKISMTLKSMEDSAKRANDIIKDLLDFSCLSSLNRHSEDLNSLIETVLCLTRHQINKNCVRVTKELADDLPRVNIDANRIEQVIINLVLNAIQATGERGELAIRTYTKSSAGPSGHSKGPSLAEGDLVVTDIEDNGCGIPEDRLNQIFDPFFTTKRDCGGVGLGLSVSKNIVELHGGSLQISNRDNGGVRARLIFKI
ncbi:MAG: ATP-binding protein [Candidatus Omnitrophota bacterium]